MSSSNLVVSDWKFDDDDEARSGGLHVHQLPVVERAADHDVVRPNDWPLQLTVKNIFMYLKWRHNFYRKNYRRQWDSNSDWRIRRQARWPLDHHHGSLITIFADYFSIAIVCN